MQCRKKTIMVATVAAGIFFPMVGWGMLFSPDDPLGIGVVDVVALNAMPEQIGLRKGWVDVTKAPFNADPIGGIDATMAIQEAVVFARYHKLVVFFPSGTYSVSDTIRCMGGWNDDRKKDLPYLPFIEQWPCILVGESRDGTRPKIVLRSDSPGFDNPARPKNVVYFNGYAWQRQNALKGALPRENGAAAFMQTLRGIDIEIAGGNPGAVALFMDSGEGSVIEDATLYAGNGFAGLKAGPGSGGAIFNVVVRGGDYGFFMNGARPTSTVVGARFSGQHKAGIHYDQRGTLTVVGCEFEMLPGVPAVVAKSRVSSALSLVDSVIRYAGAVMPVTAVEPDCAFYARNVFVENATSLAPQVPLPSKVWSRIDEVALPFDYKEVNAPIILDGKTVERLVRIDSGAGPKEDFVSKHILWDEVEMPAFYKSGFTDVTLPPYNAKGNGQTDDTDAIQRAINENDAVFLPKGAYVVTRTLELRPETALFGVSPAWSLLVPRRAEGGDFNDWKNPAPAIRTADTATGPTRLFSFGVFLPSETRQAATMLDWRAGGRSFMRSVNPQFSYSQLDWVMLEKGIFPWTNFTDGDLAEIAHLPLPEGITHRSMGNAPRTAPDGYQRQGALRTVRGHGGGGWYPLTTICSRFHGDSFRFVSIEGIEGPFSIYHAQMQYGHGDAEVEVKDSRNISVYGFKREMDAPMLVMRNTRDVLVTGLGGPGMAIRPGQAVYLLYDCANIRIANSLTDLNRVRDMDPVIRVYENGAQVAATTPPDRPVLFKWTGTKEKME